MTGKIDRSVYRQVRCADIKSIPQEHYFLSRRVGRGGEGR